MSNFDESQHPRADDGKFSEGGGGGSKAAGSKVGAANVHRDSTASLAKLASAKKDMPKAAENDQLKRLAELKQKKLDQSKAGGTRLPGGKTEEEHLRIATEVVARHKKHFDAEMNRLRSTVSKDMTAKGPDGISVTKNGWVQHGEHYMGRVEDVIATGKLEHGFSNKARDVSHEQLEWLKQVRDSNKGYEVKGRVKKSDSIIGKLRRKPDNYEDASKLQDTTGMRVVADTMKGVEEAVARVRKEYEIVHEDNYIAKPQGDYRSHHFIVKGKDGHEMELQIRTQNQQKFADWAHNVYKPLDEAQAELKSDPEVAKFATAMSNYYWEKDNGRDPGARPKSNAKIDLVFGDLPD